jgi:flagellar FliL protein
MLAIMSGKISSGKATKDDEAPAEDSAEKIEPAAKKSGKKKLVLLAAPVVLLIGVGAGLWFTGILPGLLGIGKPPAVAAADKPIVPVFVDLPDLIANLASPSTKPYYVKLQARLEITRQEDVETVKQDMPRLQDMFQTYLREMRPEELRNSGGTYRLREELLGRANVALAPVRVTDVLFTQLLIQ